MRGLTDKPAVAKWHVAVAIVLFLVVFFHLHLLFYVKLLLQPIDKSVCPIPAKNAPASFYADNSTISSVFFSDEFRSASVEKLAGAIQVDTQINDNQPDVDDAPEVWAKFAKFHEYLEKTFPDVYESLEVSTVNTYGLVFYWAGLDPSLKPVMLTAHQDVVPVQKSTLADWTYPPFAGAYDGTYVFGRGASDCKNVLIAILESLELLLKNNVKPARGIVAAFGFDEEASGFRGAKNLATFLEKKFGVDGIYAVLDEGAGLLTDPISNTIVAAPAIGEKGYIDIEVSLTTPGGHSSVPPDHTSIGIINELGYAIELDQYSPIMSDKNPFLKYLQCIAVNTDSLPKTSRKAILRAGFDKIANLKVMKMISANPLTKYYIQTSQALDKISGGEKANALPENVQMVVNHRVAVDTRVAEIQTHFSDRVVVVAKKHNLEVESFGKTVYSPEKPRGKFIVKEYSHSLEAAPLSPANDQVWEEIGAVTRHVFEDFVFTNLTYPIMLAPSMMPANTDTRYYWNLTRNIYRYSPMYVKDIMNENHVHSVDEKINFDNHLQLLGFFYEYLQYIQPAK